MDNGMVEQLWQGKHLNVIAVYNGSGQLVGIAL